jgi:hypothetical protein
VQIADSMPLLAARRADSGWVDARNRFEIALIQGVRAFWDGEPVPASPENAQQHDVHKNCRFFG